MYERRWIGWFATPAIDQFYESEPQTFIDCELCYHCPYFEEDCWDGCTEKEGGEKLLGYSGRDCVCAL